MPDLQDAAIQAAETVQTAHINHAPSAEHDIAPSTSADKKQRVEFDDSQDLGEISDDVGEDEVPISILRPAARRQTMPPLPDLRFEQSYLASLKKTTGWQGVAVITIRDQILMPLIQGLTWTLVVSGWRHWNTTTQFAGQTMGARVRRWWWGVNNWKIPADRSRSGVFQKN